MLCHAVEVVPYGDEIDQAEHDAYGAYPEQAVLFVLDQGEVVCADVTIHLETYDDNTAIGEIECLLESPDVAGIAYVNIQRVVYLEAVPQGEVPDLAQPLLHRGVVLGEGSEGSLIEEEDTAWLIGVDLSDDHLDRHGRAGRGIDIHGDFFKVIVAGD